MRFGGSSGSVVEPVDKAKGIVESILSIVRPSVAMGWKPCEGFSSSVGRACDCDGGDYGSLWGT